jgi:phasin family protein
MNAEKIVVAHKTQLLALQELTTKALETVEKISQLNIATAKTSIDENEHRISSFLSTKDVKELTKLNKHALHDLAEKAASYNTNLFNIAAGLGSEFSQIVESQLAEAQTKFVAAVEASMKHLPESTEPLKKSVKTALSNASDSMNSVKQAVKKATEANLAALTSSTTEAVKPTKKPTKVSP